MSLVVSTNMVALNTSNIMKRIGGAKAKASEKLSSGKKINNASDDAAGLAISEKMRAQIRGLKMAEKNVEDGMSLLTVQDGGMNMISDMIIRQRELIIQSLNDTNTHEDRKKIQDELDALTAEIDATAYRTEFNTIPLLTLGKSSSETVFPVNPINPVNPSNPQNAGNIIGILNDPFAYPNGSGFGFYAVSADGTQGSVLGSVDSGTVRVIRGSGMSDIVRDCDEYYPRSNQPAQSPDSITQFFTLDNGSSYGYLEDIPLTLTRVISIIDDPNGNGQFYKIDNIFTYL